MKNFNRYDSLPLVRSTKNSSSSNQRLDENDMPVATVFAYDYDESQLGELPLLKFLGVYRNLVPDSED